MTSTKHIYHTAVCLLWALALWHSWCCRGLFVDGANFLIEIVRRQWFFDFYSPRLFAMIIGQIPVLIGLKLGVTNLHWLSALLSLGLFGLPTLLYQFALSQAKEEPMLLAVVLAAIGVVFMTTSFFIVGEYNSAYAIAMLMAMHFATARRLRTSSALGMLVIGVLAIRTYEVMIYLGPLLAAMILWMLYRQRATPLIAAMIYLAVAVCLLLGMAVAINSIVHPHSTEHLEETYQTAKNFWQNMQFDLALSGAVIIVGFAFLRPNNLVRSSPYLWAGIPLFLLVLSPILIYADTLVRPLAKSQYISRTVGGLVIAAMVGFTWAYASGNFTNLKPFRVLRKPETGRRFLIFASLIVLANLPADLVLTRTWVEYLNAVRSTVQSHSRVVRFEDTPLSSRPYLLLVENWALPSQSLILRSLPTDGIIAPPEYFTEWLPFNPSAPPSLGRYSWRD